jgi:organic hydroperoxide reductase OsmC/OhrA
VSLRAKHFEYWISLDEGGTLSAEGHPVSLTDEVSAEHLLLAGLARCSISSLEHFAAQREIEVEASAYASGTVTRRESDDRYGFVEIDCKLEITLDPEPPADELRKLLESAEWGCFIGASLNPPPRYRWRVNGRDL